MVSPQINSYSVREVFLQNFIAKMASKFCIIILWRNLFKWSL